MEVRNQPTETPSLASPCACEVQPGSLRGRGMHCACPASQVPEPSVGKLQPQLAHLAPVSAAAGVPAPHADRSSRLGKHVVGKVVLSPWGSVLPVACRSHSLPPDPTRGGLASLGKAGSGAHLAVSTPAGLRPKGSMALEGPGHWGTGCQARLRRVLRPWAAVTRTQTFWTRERGCWGQSGVTRGPSLCGSADFLW